MYLVKKINHLFLFLVLASICAEVSGESIVKEKVKFSLAYEIDWPPYSATTLTNDGIVPQIMNTLFEEGQINETWVPWVRALYMGKRGDIDCLPAAYYTDERADLFYYSKSYTSNESIVISRKNESSFEYKSVKDLEGVRTGFVRGYAYPEFILNNKKILRLDAASNTALIKLLLKKQVDAIIMEKITAQYLVNTVFLKQAKSLKFHKKYTHKNNIYLICSKKSDHSQLVVDQFNKQLDIARKQGKIDKIFKSFTQSVKKSQ